MSSRYDRIAPRYFVTSDDIRSAHERGDAQFAIRDNCTVTDEARELAMKLGVRLDAPGAAGAQAAKAALHASSSVSSGAPASAAVPASPRTATAAAAPAMRTLPEDTARRVADAIAAVLAELQLGARAASLAPVLTRRVFAGLARNAQRS
jgi:hypothetical protein